MPANLHMSSPADAASFLALIPEVFAQVRAGRRVVLDTSGITVDGVPFYGVASPPYVPPSGDHALAAENLPNIFQFDGKVWTLQFDNKRVVKQKQLGFHYIHTQLKTPCADVICKDLVAAINCHKFNYSKPEQVLEENNAEGSAYTTSPKIKAGESVPVDAAVDQTTLQQVRNKMKSLQAELISYQKSGDEIAAMEAEDEIEGLENYLKDNYHKGRSTIFNSGANKNRKSVSVAIKRAIASLTEDHPALALHLKNSINTGFSCSYTPANKTEWVV